MKDLTREDQNKLMSLAYAKTDAVAEQLLNLQTKLDEFEAKLDGVSVVNNMELTQEYISYVKEMDTILNDRQLCYNSLDAEARYDELKYDYGYTDINQAFYNVVSEYGPGTPESLVAMDMIELEESVKPSEIEFERASIELDKMEAEVNVLDRVIADFNDELKNGNPYEMFTGDILKDQQAVEERAKAITEAAKLEHPIAYTVNVLKETVKDLKDSRSAAKAAGLDYQTSVEKVAKAAVAKTTGIFSTAKSGIMETLSNIAENTASIYKSACGKFADAVNQTKEKFGEQVHKLEFQVDKMINHITLGYYAQHKINNELQYIASVEGKDTSILAKRIEFINEHEHGKLGDLTIKGSEKVKDREFAKTLAAGSGMLVGMSVKLNRELFDKDLSYWEGLNKACYGDKLSFAQLDAKVSEKIGEAVLKADASVTKWTDHQIELLHDSMARTKSDLKSELLGAKENIKEVIKDIKYEVEYAKQVVVEKANDAVEFAKSAPGKVKEKINEIANDATVLRINAQAKAFEIVGDTLGKASALADKAERKISNKIESIKSFDEELSTKINNLQAQIAELRTPVQVERKEFVPSQAALDNINLLMAATPTAAVKTAMNLEISNINKEKFKHNLKEEIPAKISEIKQNLTNYGISMVKEDSLNVAVAEHTKASYNLFKETKKQEAVSNFKDALSKGQGMMLGKAAEIREKAKDVEPDKGDDVER